MTKEDIYFNSGAVLIALLEESPKPLKGGLKYREEVPSMSGDSYGEYEVAGQFSLQTTIDTGDKHAVFTPTRFDRRTFAEHFRGGIISEQVIAHDGLGRVVIRR